MIPAKHALTLYNSLSQSVEPFHPLNKNKVRMYVCGITPYDTTHLGHAFTYIFYDTLVRYLEYKGLPVNYVQNVTDVDDDLLKRARETGRNWKELGDFWTKKFLTDIRALNVRMPTHFVRATDSIEQMIAIVADLQKKDLAYEREGNVYFRVKKDKEYGKLSRYTQEQMIFLSKERGADPFDSHKEYPLDFILWQRSLPTEPSWKSPWGKGRPGWHIECSAMNYQYLGEQIDIHGGGRDLIYPHHESEIAQSEHFTGKTPFARYWLHTGAVMYQGEKMSKSLGNLVMVADLQKQYSPAAIRLLLLSHHYRYPWEFHESELVETEEKLGAVAKLLKAKSEKQEDTEDEAFAQFKTALDNDMDTPRAVQAVLYAKNQKSVRIMLQILGLSLSNA